MRQLKFVMKKKMRKMEENLSRYKRKSYSREMKLGNELAAISIKNNYKAAKKFGVSKSTLKYKQALGKVEELEVGGLARHGR